MFDKFSDRHIGVTNPEDLKAMLAVIGVKSVDELIAQVIPQSIRLKQPLALPQGMSEYEFANHIQALAAKNRTLRSFIGMGYYPCAVPAAITMALPISSWLCATWSRVSGGISLQPGEPSEGGMSRYFISEVTWPPSALA